MKRELPFKLLHFMDVILCYINNHIDCIQFIHQAVGILKHIYRIFDNVQFYRVWQIHTWFHIGRNLGFRFLPKLTLIVPTKELSHLEFHYEIAIVNALYCCFFFFIELLFIVLLFHHTAYIHYVFHRLFLFIIASVILYHNDHGLIQFNFIIYCFLRNVKQIHTNPITWKNKTSADEGFKNPYLKTKSNTQNASGAH